MLQNTEARDPFSFFRTVTVGPGFSPDLRFSLENAPAGCPIEGFTAGGDLHPALRVPVFFNVDAAAVKGSGENFRISADLREYEAVFSAPSEGLAERGREGQGRNLPPQRGRARKSTAFEQRAPGVSERAMPRGTQRERAENACLNWEKEI